jgi:hypothetical protein
MRAVRGDSCNGGGAAYHGSISSSHKPASNATAGFLTGNCFCTDLKALTALTILPTFFG